MDQYQNIQNPQLYQQILEGRKRKAKQEQIGASFGSLSDVKQEFQSTTRKEANDKKQEYYGIDAIKNTAKELRMPKWDKKEGVSQKKTDGLQWDKTTSSGQAEKDNTSRDFYDMFREAGEKTHVWTSVQKFRTSEEGRAYPYPFPELIKPGYQYLIEHLPDKAESLFKKSEKSNWQKQQELTAILKQEAENFHTYAKYGNDNEAVSITEAKKFRKGDFSQKEWDALSSDQKEALLLWQQFYDTKSDIYEYLLSNGEQGAYTWENYHAAIDKMNAVVKPDNTLWQGTKDFLYLSVKRLRGLGEPVNAFSAYILGTLVYGVSKAFEGSETGDYLKDLSARITMNTGADKQDSWLAEWLGVRQEIIDKGEEEQDIWHGIGRFTEYMLIRGTVGGAADAKFGGKIANFWGAVDTGVSEFERAYENGCSVEEARQYAYEKARLEYNAAQIIDMMHLGNGTVTVLEEEITKYLSQFKWGKAVIVMLNVFTGSTVAAIAGEAGRRTEEEYNLRPERPPEERRKDFVKDFAWNLGGFAILEFVNMIITNWDSFEGQETPEGNNERALPPGADDKFLPAPGQEGTNSNVPALPPGEGMGPQPNENNLPVPWQGDTDSNVPALPPNRGSTPQPGGNSLLPMPTQGGSTRITPALPPGNIIWPPQEQEEGLLPEQEHQIIESMTGEKTKDLTYVPGKDPRLPLPGGKSQGPVTPPPATPSHGNFPVNPEQAEHYQDQETESLIMKAFGDVMTASGADPEAFANTPAQLPQGKSYVGVEILDDGSNRYQSGYSDHMVQGELAVGKERIKGIKGGHNYDNFKLTLQQNGLDVDECIVSVSRSKDFPGLMEVEYRIPQKDSSGNAISGQYRYIRQPKTVYDPAYYSDDQMLEWGREAMQEAKNAGRLIGGRIFEGQASNGMWFRGYLELETGEITNYHPIIIENAR